MIQQQEQALLAAFRRMHPEDRELLVDFAMNRAAAEQQKTKPALRLIVTKSSKH